MNDSEESMKHFMMMHFLASDLAKKCIAVYEHEFAMLTFGSFTVIAGTRHKRWRFIWDGKDGVMTVSFVAVSDSRSAPEWRTLLSGCPSDTPYEYIKNYAYETA